MKVRSAFFIFVKTIKMNSLWRYFLILFFGIPQIGVAQNVISHKPLLPMRTMAEWEEQQAVVINWNINPPTQFAAISNMFASIVGALKDEVKVIVICKNTTDSLLIAGELNKKNINPAKITMLVQPSNSIWIRDYGLNTVYYNDVDSLAFVDWKYNRPDRIQDDRVSYVLGKLLKKNIFTTSVPPNDLVNTGGNFMTDGLGMAFASDLVLADNSAKNTIGVTPKTEAAIDSIMYQYMGIKQFIKMRALPFDVIHHIDMHIKLLDEQTLLVGEYPQGVADGPQIEANLQYLLSNFKTSFNTDFEVIRIPMPADAYGFYPNQQNPNTGRKGDYRTYTNALISNSKILLPIYNTPLDSVAKHIWQKAMPGYDIIGINSNAIIAQNGAIHCVTKEIGVDEPLWITHRKVKEYVKGTPDSSAWGAINFVAKIKHKTGIKNAFVHFRMSRMIEWDSIVLNYSPLDDYWHATIPETQMDLSDSIYYYISAVANNGKAITRPIVGAKGAWAINTPRYVKTKDVQDGSFTINKIFPNPAHAMTCIETAYESTIQSIKVTLIDIWGRQQAVLYEGLCEPNKKIFFDANNFADGVYFVRITADNGVVIGSSKISIIK